MLRKILTISLLLVLPLQAYTAAKAHHKMRVNVASGSLPIYHLLKQKQSKIIQHRSKIVANGIVRNNVVFVAAKTIYECKEFINYKQKRINYVCGVLRVRPNSLHKGSDHMKAKPRASAPVASAVTQPTKKQ